jgi:outer membrane protein assembly factor BamA
VSQLQQNIILFLKLYAGAFFAYSITCYQTAYASETTICNTQGLPINSIEYDGLNTTKRRVVDRQILLKTGDMLDCSELSKARQALEDLELFKQVSAISETITNANGIQEATVLFKLIEKRYLIVLPYVASSESGSLNYGIRGNWSNIGGLNQRAKLNLRKKTFSTDLKDKESKATASFRSPQIRNTDIDARIDLGYIDLSTRAIGEPPDAIPFNEVSRYISLGISRWYHQEQRQHGWNLGSAFSWRDWESDNPDISGNADSKQSHLGLELSAHYNKVHDHTYSYEGYTFTYRFEPSIALVGERNPVTHELNGIWHLPTGSREYSQYEIRSGLGWSNGAYEDFVPFQNSVNAQLRGITYEDFEGDRYYYLKAAYLTPFTFKPFNRTRLSAYPSVRAEVFAAVNDIYFQNGQRNLKDTAWSVGTGIRWRIPWFVGLQVGAGFAYHSEEESVGFYISGR